MEVVTIYNLKYKNIYLQEVMQPKRNVWFNMRNGWCCDWLNICMDVLIILLEICIQCSLFKKAFPGSFCRLINVFQKQQRSAGLPQCEWVLFKSDFVVIFKYVKSISRSLHEYNLQFLIKKLREQNIHKYTSTFCPIYYFTMTQNTGVLDTKLLLFQKNPF